MLSLCVVIPAPLKHPNEHSRMTRRWTEPLVTHRDDPPDECHQINSQATESESTPEGKLLGQIHGVRSALDGCQDQTTQ